MEMNINPPSITTSPAMLLHIHLIGGSVEQMFGFVPVAVLIAGWVIFGPFYKSHDHFTRSAKQMVHPQGLGLRRGDKRIGQRVFHTIYWTVTFFVLRAAQARSQTPPIDSGSGAVLTFQPANTNIWQNGICLAPALTLPIWD
jgi:hypothetical protein